MWFSSPRGRLDAISISPHPPCHKMPPMKTAREIDPSNKIISLSIEKLEASTDEIIIYCPSGNGILLYGEVDGSSCIAEPQGLGYILKDTNYLPITHGDCKNDIINIYLWMPIR